MDHAVTVGEVVWFVFITGGAIGVVGIIFWLLSVLASGFNH